MADAIDDAALVGDLHAARRLPGPRLEREAGSHRIRRVSPRALTIAAENLARVVNCRTGICLTIEGHDLVVDGEEMYPCAHCGRAAKPAIVTAGLPRVPHDRRRRFVLLEYRSFQRTHDKAIAVLLHQVQLELNIELP